MNKRKIWIAILSIALLGMVALAVIKGRSKPRGEAVTVEKAELRNISEKVMASGRIYPETEVKISSDVSGEIVELFVAEGDSVVAGQVLARIDPDTYISAVERGEASLNNSRANLATSESQIENANAQKQQIMAQLTNARRIHERNIDLLANGVISQADFDLSLSNMEALEANLNAAEASLSAAKKSADAARYLVRSAEASLKELKVSLNRTTIKSPTSGIVSSLFVEQGERVVGTMQMTGTEMMRIANMQNMEVQVEVSENDILRVKLGDSVDIEVDAYLDKVFKGVVTQIANSASNIGGAGNLSTDQVTNFIVKVRMDPRSYEILITRNRRAFPFRPGMSATVDIFTDHVSNAISIPIQAVTVRESRENGEKGEMIEVVFIMKEDKAFKIEVSTGIQDDRYVHVISGLNEGDMVITGPYNTVAKELKDGSDVYIKKEKIEKKEAL